jgi:proteasome component ECM29
LDLLPLLKHYGDSSNSFLINFAIIYITIGFPRLDVQKQIELVPSILRCIESKPEPHQNKLLLMILPLLGEIKISDKKDDLELSERTNARQMLLSMLLDVLLLPYGHFNENEIPPGMSPYSLRRVSLEDKRAEHLENVIYQLFKILADLFKFPHILVEERNCQVFGQ